MMLRRNLLILIFCLLGASKSYALCGIHALDSSGCAPFVVVLFDNDSVKVASTRLWTITHTVTGQSYTDTGFVYPQVLTATGTYNVTMTVTYTDGTSCNVSMPNFIHVYGRPHANFTVAPNNICFGDSVTICNLSTTNLGSALVSSIVDLKNGLVPSIPPNTCKTFVYPNTVATYCPSIITTNSDGCTDDSTMTGANCIKVKASPIASFTSTNPVTCLSSKLVTFTAGPTNSLGTMNYEWYYQTSGGSSWTLFGGNSATAAHTFTSGVYDVKLVVTDALAFCSATSIQSSLVNIGVAPAPTFTANATTICNGGYVNFSDNTPGTPISWSWSFPGGSPRTSTSQNPSILYYGSDTTYPVTLTVSFVGGCNQTLTKTNFITVQAYPSVNFTISDSTLCLLPATTHLTYTGNACVGCTYNWSVTNGGILSTASSPNTDLTSNTANKTYDITLDVHTSSGCAGSKQKIGGFNTNGLVAKFNRLKSNNCLPLNITYTNASISTTPITSYSWKLKNGSFTNNTIGPHIINYTVAGCYKDSFTITNSQGCVSKYGDSICVGDTISASMAFTPRAICFKKDSIEFTVSSTPSSFDYINFWPYAPINNTTLLKKVANVFYQNYDSLGSFHPCFEVVKNGCSTKVCLADSVTINGTIAKFSRVKNCAAQDSIILINQSRKYNYFKWRYWNGSSFITNTVDTNLKFKAPTCGSYFVELYDSNTTSGCVNIDTQTINILCKNVQITTNLQTGCTPLTLYLSATVSAGSAPYTSILWDNDGYANGISYTAGTGTNDSRAYFSPGNFDIFALITYSDGCTDTFKKTSYVHIPGLVANFTATPPNGCIPLNVNFVNTTWDTLSPTSPAYVCSWSLTGLTLPTPSNPNQSVSFLTSGSYGATLTVTNGIGCTSSKTVIIEANDVHASFTGIDTFTCPGATVPLDFINTSTGINLNFKWTSQKGTPSFSNTTDFTVNYPANTPPGKDTIKLIASDQNGTCVDSMIQIVNVYPPIANYSISDTFANCPPLTAYFRDSSLNDINSWDLTFGDNGTHSTTASPTHIYGFPGTYPTCLVVTTNNGCSDTLCKAPIKILGPTATMTKVNLHDSCICKSVILTTKTVNAVNVFFSFGGGIPSSHNYFGVSPIGTIATPKVMKDTVTYCSVGVFKPQLIVVDFVTGCLVKYGFGSDSLVPPIVVDTPVIGFNFTKNSSCDSATFCFTDTTKYHTTYAFTASRTWNFGDVSSGIANTSTALNPCHKYNTSGKYKVTLTVVSSLGCTKIFSDSITIFAKPIASYVINDSTGCLTNPVKFYDKSTPVPGVPITNWDWVFTNGTSPTATGNFATSVFSPLPGIYNSLLTITDANGCKDTATRSINISPAPKAYFTADSVCLGNATTFTDNSGVGITNNHWEFNYTGTSNSGTSNNLGSASSILPIAGNVPVYLKITNASGCVGDTILNTYVYALPTADFNAGFACRGNGVNFTDNSSQAIVPISTYLWTFTSPSLTDPTKNPTHTFPTVGQFPVMLTVTDQKGCTGTVTKPVTINDKPTAIFTILDDTVCLGEGITVNDNSNPSPTSPITAIGWDMESNGSIDFTSSSVTYPYPVAGSYTITLMVTDQNTCTDTLRKQVKIWQGPVASYTATVNCVGVQSNFTNTTIPGENSNLTYTWTFPVPTVLNTKDAAYTFTTVGDTTVDLFVTDGNGCKSDFSQNYTLFLQPDLSVSKDTTVCLGYSVQLSAAGNYQNISWSPTTWVDNPNTSNINVTPLNTIDYVAAATNPGCIASFDTVRVTVIQPIPISLKATPSSIVLGMSSNVTSTINGTIDSIIWSNDSTLSCRNCENPVATPHATTTYKATIYFSKNGVTCSNTDSITINVLKSCGGNFIYLPNTFTPNGDGNNEKFRIRGLGIAKVNYFRVYDRWGNEVFNCPKGTAYDDDATQWNGNIHNTGNPANGNSFTYSFEVECITGDKVTGSGNITLVR